jgi:capsular polysaccharide biosynthesis protein
LAAAFRRSRWVILVLIVIGAVAGAGLALSSKNQYQAVARLSITEPDISTLVGSQGQEPPDRYVATQIGILQSNPIAQTVAKQLPGETMLSVQKAVSVAQEGTSDIVAITATGSSATRASALANLMGDTYVAQQRAQLRSLLDQSISSLQSQMKAISAQISASGTNASQTAALQSQYTQLSQTLNQVRLSEQLALGSTQFFDRAIAPAAPKPRHTLEKTGLGLTAGLVVGLLLAVLRAAIRPRLSRTAELEDSLGMPVAAELPWSPSLHARGDDALDIGPLAREIFKTSVFIEAATAKGPCKTVLVTSAERRSGVSTVAGGIAEALARGDYKVDLVSLVDPSPSAHSDQVSPDDGYESTAAGAEAPNRRSSAAGGVVSARAIGVGRRNQLDAWLGHLDRDTDVLVFDGGSLRRWASTMTQVHAVDVIVLVVPLPTGNERQMNAVLRAVLTNTQAQLIVVANHLDGRIADPGASR